MDIQNTKTIMSKNEQNTNLDFQIGEVVYLKTDITQSERIVTGIQIRLTGVTYGLSFYEGESWHYNFEITKERDVVKATS